MKGNCVADKNICVVVNQDVVHKRLLVRPRVLCHGGRELAVSCGAACERNAELSCEE